MNPRRTLPAPGPDGSTSEQRSGCCGPGMAPAPPRASGPPSPQAGRTVLVRTAGYKSPPHAGRRLPRASGSPWDPGQGLLCVPPHGRKVTPGAALGTWGWVAHGLGSSLSLALQRRGRGRGGHPWRGPRCPASPHIPELPTRLSPSLQGWALSPLPLPGGGLGKEGHRPGRARVRPRGGSRAAVAGRGALARCPCSPHARARQRATRPRPRPGGRRAVGPCCLGPRPPTSRPPARRLAWVTLRKEFIVRN